MTLREKIENHVGIFALVWFVAGATLMFGLRTYLLRETDTPGPDRPSAVVLEEQNRLRTENTRLTEELSQRTRERDQWKAEAERLRRPDGQPSPDKRPPPPDAPPAPESRQVDGYLLPVPACQREGADVVCEVRVTNQKEDRRLWIYKNSRILDSQTGDTHQVCQSSIGGAPWSMMGNDAAYVDIPTDGTVRARLKFCGIAQSLRQISIFELQLKGQNVLWRGVPLN